MISQVFNPMEPVYKEKRELRFLVSDIDILQFVDQKDRFVPTYDYYVPCKHEELPIKLRVNAVLVPSFLRTRVMSQNVCMGCEIIFTHAPTYKEKLLEEHFKIKYPSLMDKVAKCKVKDALVITKQKVGNLILPELTKSGCLEMIEISSEEYDGYRFLSGEFEYDNEQELKSFFLAIKYHPVLSLMCAYNQFLCTYSSLLDIMYSNEFSEIRDLMKLKYKYLMNHL